MKPSRHLMKRTAFLTWTGLRNSPKYIATGAWAAGNCSNTRGRAVNGIAPLIALAFQLHISVIPASAADWFVNKPHQCASNLSSMFVVGGPLERMLHPAERTSFAGTGNSVRLVYKLSTSEMAKPRVMYQASLVTVDDRAKQDLKAALSRAAGKDPMPVVEGLSDIVLNIAPTVVSLSWDAILSAAKEMLKAKPLDVEAISLLIANGGRITRDVEIQKNATGELWANVFWNYRVDVGSEKRSIILASCRLPVEVSAAEFRTNEIRGNKIIKPRDQNFWGIFDIEDNKWDSAKLKYIEQDKEFFYFTEDALENNIVKGQHMHRLGYLGGSHQYKSFFDGPDAVFKNFSGPLAVN